jgi:hypothetical protein
MRTPVDFNLAVVQAVAPFAQRVRRQRQRGSLFADAHSALQLIASTCIAQNAWTARLRPSVLMKKLPGGAFAVLSHALHGATRGAIPSDIP